MEEQYYQILRAWTGSHLEPVMFYLLAFLAIPLAYGVIFDPRIIRCGFLLIGVFSTISGVFMLLEAQFLALAQIMIYAVGITLVVVIALMLTNPRMELDISPALTEHKGPAILVAALVFIAIYFGLRSESWQAPASATAIPAEANIGQIGVNLLGYYSIPFEFASILLLIALIGAVMLAKAERPTRAEEWIEEDEMLLDRSEDNVVKV